MSFGYFGRDYYPPSRPREARGGIRAHSRRGAFGQSWWAQRWSAVLGGFFSSGRLARGRAYARQGQVLSIDIEKGKVRAKVQGSRPKPYQVSIAIQPLSPDEWKRIGSALARQVVYAAKLLSGEMPPDLEEVFKKSRLPLFPARTKDLNTDCSCPDWENPCKHIAAVYYLLAEEFDRDPFLLLKLRGIEREELVELLKKGGRAPRPRNSRSEEAAGAGREASAVPPPDPAAPSPPEEPLASGPDFWSGKDLPANFFGEVEPPPSPGALLKRLGHFPFWRGEEPLVDQLEPLYPEASARALLVFLGRAD